MSAAATAPARPRPTPRARPKTAARPRPVTLLTPGNTKLGPMVWCWSIPAGGTCPGKTAACVDVCYAARNFFVKPNVRARHRYNWERSREPGFAGEMAAEIRRGRLAVVRIHVAGDFYDAAYAAKWLEVARRCPDATFYAYTRSWRVPAIRDALRRLAVASNVFLWYSTDRDSGPAPRDAGVRHAYMLLAGEDEAAIPPGTDLVFRVKDRTPRKRAAGVLVCPAENGVEPSNGKMTCSRCTICFSHYRPRIRTPEKDHSLG